MASNEDKVDAVLNKMEQDNDPQALSDGLNVLCKLTSKYFCLYPASSRNLSNRSTEVSRPPTTPSKIKS